MKKERKKILVIDDEVNILEAIKRMLHKTEYECFTAHCVNEAMVMMEQSSYAVVLFDYYMPGKNGADFLLEARQRWPHTRYVLITGDPREEVIENAYANGAQGYLIKPFSRAYILRVIEYQLNDKKERYMKRKIMLVDDEKNVLDGLERALNNKNYDITKCTQAIDAWDILEQDGNSFDLIISDNKMPRIKGTDLLIAIRKKYPDIMRIMLTGQSSLEDAQRAINEGEVYKFLLKPVQAEELRLTVIHALAYRDLWEKNKKLIKKVEEQQHTIQTLEKEHPGITHVERDSTGNIVINDTETLDEFMKKYFQ